MSTPTRFHTYIPGQHIVKGIPFKAHKINGFSAESLEQYFEAIYGGAIRRLNEIELKIAADKEDCSEALKLELQNVANSIVLHEIFFESIGEDGDLDISDPTLQESFIASFGSYAEWKEEFISIAISKETRWMVLAWSERFKRLVNLYSTSDTQELFVADPILVLDMSEHAYLKEFGSNRTSYVTAFVNSIDWKGVTGRFQQAIRTVHLEDDSDSDTQISVADLKAQIDGGDDVIVLDVRHDDDRERYRSRIMETEFRDSFDVASWADNLPKDKRVVVYCMYGFWVSTKAAQELRNYGVDARSLSGGVLSWRAMGYPSSDNEF